MNLTRENVANAYQLLLDREASEAEISGTLKQGHENLRALRRSILNSYEFGQKFTRLKQQTDAGRPPTLVHLHIPKTAGTSLAEALAVQPALQPNMVVHDGTLAELCNLPRPKRRQLRYVRGHLSMGAGEALGMPFRYMCLIRRPGQRIFSFYQFIKRSRTHPDFTVLNEKDMSFGEYLEFSVNELRHRLELDNGQIRRLSGEFNAASIGHEQTLLRKALHAALDPDMLLGFVEKMDAFTQTLVELGYLADANIERANVSPNSELYVSACDALTEEQTMIFENYTAWDTYFYDVSQALLLSSPNS